MINTPGSLPEIARTERIQQAPTTKVVADREFVNTFKPADTTPSVLNLTKFAAGNTIANNVTYFDDGFDGQEISILGDGFTTLLHNVTKIALNTGANKLLSTLKVYRFTRYNKVWIEDSIT